MALEKLGKYERLDVLGHGASGIVYLAKDTLLGKQVALKEISAQGDEKERFLEEARVLDRLRHPNIVQVNSVDEIGGRGREDVPRARSVEHAATHGHHVSGLVTRPRTLNDRNAIGRRRIGAHDEIIRRNVFERRRIGERDAFEHVRNELLRVVYEFLQA